ncbi:MULTISPECIES: glycosyltransferase [unclassified Nostoc]|uniref:glycosyltransferase n=1 Tax=unclassified Nostoc TaxID=2593658 RepID=UPI002AD48017|nr:glycosyltransferase [Nostoc sp. DedQUE03]MDZ7975608.1 glycosyltransferase [Nostoc sp. DedQUE03]MDZ8045430.1 glycosyltransferase [Nostoc sp. DedQUE02]
MKVSVLMITYNHDKFIAKAIESVLIQQVNFEYELVIGEDCSTDTTRQIAIDYQKRYPDKIRLLLPNNNLGMNQNLVNTFNACTGQYIAILEADDYWIYPDKLQKQVDFLDKRPEYAICFHNAIIFWEDNRQPPGLFRHKQKETSSIEDLLIENFIPTASVMYRNGLIKNFPQWFYELSMGDWVIHILNAQYGNIGYINEVMSAYRLHTQGVWTSKSDEQRLPAIIKMFSNIREYLDVKYHATIDQSINYYSNGLNYVLKQKEYEKYSISETLCKTLSLRNINLIIFPDWKQTNNFLYENLKITIIKLISHHDISQLTLIIDISNVGIEDAESILSDILFSISLEENIDISEDLSISFVGNMNQKEWTALLPCISARISLNIENKEAIIQAQAQNIPVWDVESISKIQTSQIN